MSWGAGRRDYSESAIAGALVKAGCAVEYAVKRPYDLIVGRGGQNYLIEVKTGNAPLRLSQVEFQKTWPGQYAVVRSAEEALRAVGL